MSPIPFRILLGLSIAPLSLTVGQDVPPSVATAVQAADEAALQTAVSEWAAALGESAGAEEPATSFQFPGDSIKEPKFEELSNLFQSQYTAVKDDTWWHTVKSPTDCKLPLRWVANVLEGAVAAEAAGCAPAADLKALAKETATFLLKAQQEAETGFFPFPAWPDRRGKLGQLIGNALKNGDAAKSAHQGWFIGSLPGNAQSEENAACGLALLAYHGSLRKAGLGPEAADLATKLKTAANWAAKQPASPNWGENALPVIFLAEAAMELDSPEFATAGLKMAKIGILPGQLKKGKAAGNWLDPQNARLVPHFQLLRALIQLHAALPLEHPDLKPLEFAILAGLVGRNAEIAAKGSARPEVVAETYFALLSRPERFEHLLAVTGTPKAAEITFLGLVEEFQQAHPSITPSVWGRYLQFKSTTLAQAK